MTTARTNIDEAVMENDGEDARVATATTTATAGDTHHGCCTKLKIGRDGHHHARSGGQGHRQDNHRYGKIARKSRTRIIVAVVTPRASVEVSHGKFLDGGEPRRRARRPSLERQKLKNRTDEDYLADDCKPL